MVALFGNTMYVGEFKKERSIDDWHKKREYDQQASLGKKDNRSQCTLLTVFQNCCAVSLLEFVSKWLVFKIACCIACANMGLSF